MSDPTDEFFDRLRRHGYESQFEHFLGSVRFDIRSVDGADRWLLVVEHGRVEVTRGNGQADLVITSERATFNRVLTSGQGEFFAAYVRHAFMTEGNTRMLLMLQALDSETVGRHPKSMPVVGGDHGT